MSLDHGSGNDKLFVDSAKPMNRVERMKLLRTLIAEIFDEEVPK